MAKLIRQHQTKLPIIIDTEDGPEEITIDLAELSDDELAQYIFDVPQAVEEIVYRELNAQLGIQDNDNK